MTKPPDIQKQWDAKKQELSKHLEQHRTFTNEARKTVAANQTKAIQLQAQIETLQSLLPKPKAR
jgi:hypothetical protein